MNQGDKVTVIAMTKQIQFELVTLISRTCWSTKINARDEFRGIYGIEALIFEDGVAQIFDPQGNRLEECIWVPS